MGLFSFLARAASRIGQVVGSALGRAPSPRVGKPKVDPKDPQQMKYNQWRGGSSSWIAALRWNGEVPYGQMRVKRGKVYTFARMTLAVFEEWFKSPSWGKHFNKKLKGRYTRT